MAPSLDKKKNNCINPCGYKTMFGTITTGDQVKHVTARMYCKTWSCPFCGPRKAWLYQQLIAERAIEFKLDRFMTLTLDPKKIKGNSYKHINESWRKLREAFRRKFGKSISYISITEEHKSGIPHKHILVDHFIHQKWLSAKWSNLGGGPMVDIRKIKDIKNMARYVGKYLTKDVLLSAPKGTRRITTSQDIKLRVKQCNGKWSISDAKLETLFGLQKHLSPKVVTEKSGRLKSFETTHPLDLDHWNVPNDRPYIKEGDRELFPEFPENWELIATYQKEDQRDEELRSIRKGLKQRTTSRRIFNPSSTQALGGLLPGARIQNYSNLRGCGNRQKSGPTILRRNAGFIAGLGGLQFHTG